MTDCFIGEIRAFSMGWAPSGWALCDGAQLSIQANAALYSVIGTAFGGDGVKNFNLPDLRGRTPVGINPASADYQRGKAGGAEGVALTSAQIPSHNHQFQVLTAAGAFPLPTGNIFSSVGGTTKPNLYAPPSTTPLALNPSTVNPTPAAATHGNVQPSVVINYCIALSGIYPPRN